MADAEKVIRNNNEQRPDVTENRKKKKKEIMTRLPNRINVYRRRDSHSY